MTIYRGAGGVVAGVPADYIDNSELLAQAVGRVATLAALRALTATDYADGDAVYVTDYATQGDGAGGLFYWDASSTDSDDVGITVLPTGYTGTGRWKRSYSGAINVKWFGVTGDGTTDDTAALELASTTGGSGATFTIPAGANCSVASTFDLATANQTWLGYGATLTQSASFSGTLDEQSGYQMFIHINASGVTLEGFTLAGASLGSTGVHTTPDNCSGLTLKNLDVSGFGYGLRPNNNSNLLVEGNYVHGNSLYGVNIHNTAGTSAYDNIRVLNNRIDQSHLDPATSTKLCLLVRGDATYVTTNVLVSGNKFIQCTNPTASTPLGCEMHFVDGGVFSNNYSKDGSMLVSVALSVNVTVDGNVADGPNFYAIELAPASAIGLDNVVVSNNVIHGRGRLVTGIALQGTYQSQGAVITGNVIKGIKASTGWGIYVNSYWDSVIISGNSIYMDTGAYGIYFLGSTSDQIENVSITGNMLDGAGVGLKGVFLRNVSNATVTGNIFDNWAQDGINVYADTVTVNYITCVGNVFTSTNTNEVQTGTINGGSIGTRVMVIGSPDFRKPGGLGANCFDLSAVVGESWNTGSPEGVSTGGVGSTYRRTNGSKGQTLYVKESGTGNTGWGAIATSSTTTGGTGSAGAGNQYVELNIGGVTYKVLHDGTV